jgi:hypothetical protein
MQSYSLFVNELGIMETGITQSIDHSLPFSAELMSEVVPPLSQRLRCLITHRANFYLVLLYYTQYRVIREITEVFRTTSEEFNFLNNHEDTFASDNCLEALIFKTQ